jgi:hypothetical protein
MAGKLKDVRVNVLPNFGETPENDVERKLYDVNNSSYTDGFFYFLSSILLNQHGFINGIDFFGSYLCIKKEMTLNIADDVQYLYASEFFKSNRGKLFNVNSEQEAAFVKDFTRNCKKRLELGETIDNRSVDSLDIIEDLNEIFVDNVVAGGGSDQEAVVVMDDELPTREREDSECSSRYSSSTGEENEEILSEASGSGSDSEWETDSEEGEECGDEEMVEATVNEFPANLIFIEKMVGTLDSLLDNIDEDELKAALFQVVMTLIAYNKAFDFTHNDLHTNNVMYVNTTLKHLIYRFDGKCYKVPTYGRIFKIIDFGRSIYRYNGKLHHNDSYAVDNDAAGQFNFEPYYTDGKPTIMPNNSFDLCRLACSMYDNFFDFTFEEEDLGEDLIVKRIADWCKDDKGKNVLYKKNGEERYEGFKLYKMITRTVHGCVPREEVNKSVFAGYLMTHQPKKDATIIDIDAIPVYV